MNMLACSRGTSPTFQTMPETRLPVRPQHPQQFSCTYKKGFDHLFYCIYNSAWKSNSAPPKNERNIALGRPSFKLARDFDLDSAHIVVNDRHDYGEDRFRAVGVMGSDVAVLVFIMRGENLRVISLHLANRKERKAYDEA
jgi:uncharacterized protein